MNTLAMLGSAVITVCQPVSLLFMIGGVAIGIVFGSIPGLSASMAVALMLPLTFGMEASLGMNVLVAVYIGGISGGLISAILLNMPGTASSIATTFDGYPMAQKGEAMRALGIGIVFSFLGSLFSFIILSFFAPKLADIALCAVGAYATNNRVFDVQAIIVFGIVGYIYHKLGLPTTPFVLCFLVGNMTETYLRRGIMSYKSFEAFFTHPIFDVFFFIAIGILLYSVLKEIRKGVKGK